MRLRLSRDTFRGILFDRSLVSPSLLTYWFVSLIENKASLIVVLFLFLNGMNKNIYDNFAPVKNDEKISICSTKRIKGNT